jgi:activator of HSP90 ATPase
MKSKTNGLTRRAFAGTAAAMAVSAAGLPGLAQQPQMTEQPATPANTMKTSLHQELAFDAPPHRIFHILTDSKEFAAMTGMDASIDSAPGGAFKTFSGMIEGRNVEIIPDQRIVQAWRPASWDPGVYSVVHFELKTAGAGTAMVLDHTGFPPGDFDHLDPGWHIRYWDPLKKYLATHS